MQAVFETLFDIVYLSTVITLGYRMIRGGKDQKQYLLFGIMAVVLGCGDAFHLIPRAVALCTTGLESYPAALVVEAFGLFTHLRNFTVQLSHIIVLAGITLSGILFLEILRNSIAGVWRYRCRLSQTIPMAFDASCFNDVFPVQIVGLLFDFDFD